MASSVNVRALQLASRILGGPRKLREHLGVSASELAGWISGRTQPPREVLLKALDVILDDLDAGAPRLRRLEEEG